MNDHYVFAHVALRDSASADPQGFLAAMNSPHAAEALAGLWEHVQGALGGRPKAPRGLSADVWHLPGGRRMVLVRLPPPRAVTECHFVGVVVEPQFRYVTLEASESIDGEKGTVLAEWVPEGEGFQHVNYGEGPPPLEPGFLKAVELLLAGRWISPDEEGEAEEEIVFCDVCGKPGQAVQDPRGGPFSVALCPEHESGEDLGVRIHCGCVALVGALLLLGAAYALWRWVL